MLDLEPIKARMKATTPGPYDAPLKNLEWVDYFDENYEIYSPLGEAGPIALVPTKNLAIFFTHSRTDIPALVAEVEKLRTLCNAVLTEQICGVPDEIISPELEKAIHNALQ